MNRGLSGRERGQIGRLELHHSDRQRKEHATKALSETSFDKNTTYQGRRMGSRRVSKEHEDMSKNNKTEDIG